VCVCVCVRERAHRVLTPRVQILRMSMTAQGAHGVGEQQPGVDRDAALLAVNLGMCQAHVAELGSALAAERAHGSQVEERLHAALVSLRDGAARARDGEPMASIASDVQRVCGDAFVAELQRRHRLDGRDAAAATERSADAQIATLRTAIESQLAMNDELKERAEQLEKRCGAMHRVRS
jgi:hypothetical protein